MFRAFLLKLFLHYLYRQKRRNKQFNCCLLIITFDHANYKGRCERKNYHLLDNCKCDRFSYVVSYLRFIKIIIMAKSTKRGGKMGGKKGC
jgi:hypothetical protein